MTARSWVTAERVAQHVGVAKDTVYRCHERKSLPENKIRRLWKIQRFQVDEWVKAGFFDDDANEQKNVIYAAHREVGDYRTLPLACLGSGQ